MEIKGETKGGRTMTKLRMIGVAALAFLMMAPNVMARGGAVSGGMRGAVVGGMAGGSSGAKTGAKVGVVAGATRGVAERTADRRAMDSETQSRTQYESSTEYQSAQHSDYSDDSPNLMIDSPSDKSATQGGEAIIRKDGKPIVGITYPSDWKQKEGDNYVSAISPKGNAWSALATLERAKDKQAGINKVKQGLEKYLSDIDYDDPTKTESGALVITGTGKAKKAGIPVVFAVGVFEAGKGQLAGVAFVADKNIEDHFKEAARHICKTIQLEKDLAEQKHEVARRVTN